MGLWNNLPGVILLILLLLFSHSVMSDSLGHHALQQAMLPCPSLSPEFSQTQSIKSMMSSSHLILYHPLLLLPSIFPSIKVFSNELALGTRWPPEIILQSLATHHYPLIPPTHNGAVSVTSIDLSRAKKNYSKSLGLIIS